MIFANESSSSQSSEADRQDSMTSFAATIQTALAARSVVPSHLIATRHLSSTKVAHNASQPASSSPKTRDPHAARVAAARSSNTDTKEDARSRLAKLQAQRLEELKRGRGNTGGAKPNRPEQKWSNRTLIALATSVGACTYLMGTYHGYNAGKSYAMEDMGRAEDSGAIPLPTLEAASVPQVGAGAGRGECEERPEKASDNCRLAELTQYHCDLHKNRVVCQPIDRIFRICKGRPAVEVSHIVEFDESGKPHLPPHLSEAMPPSSHWHELRSPDL
ncbi:uncharacterized protein MEPE_02261 [Melanopsichium pennsylvanicum]|uniref:Uncharacterized protein n=1 Tax=Melanopsichium pennsylvanicum TaxID=63383 RepID=A0AAJ4XJK6_9BASI|nr:uncharacterized protein MEPE_02261 [Melanopsichium pennsylvanicum]